MIDCRACERMKQAETEIIALQKGAEVMDNKLDRLQYWIMTSTAGIVATLLILLYQVSI